MTIPDPAGWDGERELQETTACLLSITADGRRDMKTEDLFNGGSLVSPVAHLLIRLMVGSVFLSEGLQKFLFPEALGVGRFIKIGIAYPGFAAPFVGVVEIVCGLLFLVGLYTQLAAIPLIIDMLVAIATTKIPFFLQHGFWPVLHEARVDWCMLLGSLFLLIGGGGGWALDAMIHRRRSDVEHVSGRIRD
jgi:putative oxidoreductase